MSAKPSAVRRKATAPAAVREDTSLLEPVFAAIRKLAGKTRQEDAAAFANAFYQRMGEDELPLHSPEGWAALAHDFLEFARSRKPGTASVRASTTRSWLPRMPRHWRT